MIGIFQKIEIGDSKMKKTCIQCGLPDLKITYGRNSLSINENNVCIFCNDYNENKKYYDVNFKTNQDNFKALCDKIRGKQKYDAVIMYTGGKDSGYAAYYLKEILKLKVLAFTWDNGFFGDQHARNLVDTVKNLGIEHRFISIGENNLSEFYSNRFKKLGRFCACTQPALLFCAPEIEASEAPLIVMGVSFGQQLSLLQNRFLFEFNPAERQSLLPSLTEKGMGIYMMRDPGFLIGALLDVVCGSYSPSMEELLKNCFSHLQKMMQEERYISILSLIFNFDHKTITEVLSRYGWKKPDNAHNVGHTSCIMEHMKGYTAYKQDMLNLDYLEIAAERRWGRMTKELFNEVLPTIHYTDDVPREMEPFLKISKMSRKEVEQVLSEKPFARAIHPPINWELVKKLDLNMEREQLSRYMALAYSRGIP
jgi:hypothetical protein